MLTAGTTQLIRQEAGGLMPLDPLLETEAKIGVEEAEVETGAFGLGEDILLGRHPQPTWRSGSRGATPFRRRHAGVASPRCGSKLRPS
jgi:hypothetical protein